MLLPKSLYRCCLFAIQWIETCSFLYIENDDEFLREKALIVFKKVMKVVRKKERHPESILPIALVSTAVIESRVNRKPIESVTGTEVCLMPVNEMESSSQIGFALADVWLRESSGVAATVFEFGITSSTTRYLPVSQYV